MAEIDNDLNEIRSVFRARGWALPSGYEEYLREPNHPPVRIEDPAFAVTWTLARARQNGQGLLDTIRFNGNSLIGMEIASGFANMFKDLETPIDLPMPLEQFGRLIAIAQLEADVLLIDGNHELWRFFHDGADLSRFCSISEALPSIAFVPKPSANSNLVGSWTAVSSVHESLKYVPNLTFTSDAYIIENYTDGSETKSPCIVVESELTVQCTAGDVKYSFEIEDDRLTLDMLTGKSCVAYVRQGSC